jgi:methylmalonyl-CoA mutase
VQGIRAACPGAIIALAGYPPDQIEALKKAGVDEFIHVRADAAQLLGNFHAKLGISL